MIFRYPFGKIDFLTNQTRIFAKTETIVIHSLTHGLKKRIITCIDRALLINRVASSLDTHAVLQLLLTISRIKLHTTIITVIIHLLTIRQSHDFRLVSMHSFGSAHQ